MPEAGPGRCCCVGKHGGSIAAQHQHSSALQAAQLWYSVCHTLLYCSQPSLLSRAVHTVEKRSEGLTQNRTDIQDANFTIV